MKISIGFISVLIFLTTVTQDASRYRREKMVSEQLENRDISNVKVLNAMRQVERHRFVPENVQDLAYNDQPLPIGEGQTISQPYMVAYMTQVIKPKKSDKVLEIGTGSGYQAAVLAEIVKEVYTIEIVKPLAMLAKERLKQLGYNNIFFKVGDGYNGWPDKVPFNAIIVTAGAEEIPQPLINQLAEGGRMVIPVGPHNGVRLLTLITKRNGKIKKKILMAVRFVPFTREKN